MLSLSDLKKKIEDCENFSFVKLGDGEMLAMMGAQGQNCDGQVYSPQLGSDLRSAFRSLGAQPNVFITRWKLGMEDEIDFLEGDLGIACTEDHDLLLNRILSQENYDFWNAVKESKRRKIFVGPERLLFDVVSFLTIDIGLVVPIKNSFSFKYKKNFALEKKPEDNDIFLFSAGMPSKIWIADLLEKNPNITCLDCGSAFDPIFVGQTRTNQKSQAELQNYFKNLL